MKNDSLLSRIISLTDTELKKVLILRKDYRREAVEIACNEAIKRGMITSIDEIDEYAPYTRRHGRPGVFSPIRSKKTVEKLTGSLKRIGLLIGIIPLLLAVEHIKTSNYVDLIICLIASITWMVLIQISSQNKSKLYSRALLAFGVVISSYYGCHFFDQYSENLISSLVLLIAVLIPNSIAYLMYRFNKQLDR